MSNKKYIIFTSGISDMGGAEMFTSNKIEFLKQTGWDVDVYFYRRINHIMIQNLEHFRHNRIPKLYYPPIAFTNKEVKEVVKQIAYKSDTYTEVVIETQLLTLSYWGELLAEYIGAKHIVNIMEEHISTRDINDLKFLERKLKRNEILNMVNRNVLKRYFGSYVKLDYEKYIHDYFVSPVCSNVTINKDIDLSYIRKADYTIISLGRLDKPYIIPMFIALKEYFIKHPYISYNLLVIGGSPQGDAEESINKLFLDCSNATVYHHGYLYPIPSNLIKRADIGIAMANSVDVLTNEGIPTINIDINDLNPIGYYKITTNNKFNRNESDGNNNLDHFLDIGLNSSFVFDVQLMHTEQDSTAIFTRQIDFLKLNQTKEYCFHLEDYPLILKLKARLSRVLHTKILRDINY